MLNNFTPKSKQIILGVVLILLAVLAVNIPAVKAEFIWDDDTHVTSNLITKQGGLYDSWFSRKQSNYWPVTWTFFWVQWKLWGMSPAGYHIVTVLLHGICAVLVWITLRKLRIPGAWLAALLFAIHPVNVETAAWITQQKNILSMFFGTLTVLLFLRFTDNKSYHCYFCSVIAFLVSLLAKTSTVTFPFVLILCVWWKYKKLTIKDAFICAPFFILSLILGLTEIWFQYNRAMAVSIKSSVFSDRLAGAGHAIFFYLSKTVFPYKLCFVYPNRTFDGSFPSSYIPLIIVTAGMLVLLYRRNSWGRPVVFGLGYFFLTIAPVLGFLNIYFMRYSWVSDHWQYVSIIGPIALIIGGLTTLVRRSSPVIRRISLLAAAAAVILLGCQSFDRAKAFKSSEALWVDTLRKNPNAWIAYNNLAFIFIDQGRLNEANELLKNAITVNPEDRFIRLNLARVLEKKGKISEAMKHVEYVIRIDSEDLDAQYEKGRLLMGQGRFPDAKKCFNKTLKSNPAFMRAYVGLALVADKENDLDQAVDVVQKALRINPGYAPAYHVLGDIMFDRGNMKQSLDYYLKTAEINPQYPDVHNDLGIVYAKIGELDQAVTRFKEALKIKPKDSKVRLNLDRALKEQMNHE
ncbi:tetratricopeptide repeat protein [Verrucomicrobiota bacterium]